jgi:putative phage-type endonuclease
MLYKRNGKPQGDSWSHELTWRMDREKGVGGSEIASILGISPWLTAYQLWEYKTGKKESKDMSTLSHIQRGILGEKMARRILEDKYKRKYVPHTWTIEGTPYRCSDDGFCCDNEILEIKCMGQEAHEKVREGYIPEYYMTQCIWNLFVSGAEQCRFVSFRPEDEDMIEIVVRPSPRVATKYRAAVDKFWECVTKNMPPPLSDRDAETIQDAAFSSLEKQWVSLKDEQTRLQERIDEIEGSLRGYTSKHPRVKGDLIQITRTTRLGSVDYKRAFSEVGISLDDYRREPTELVRITRIEQGVFQE